MGETIILQATHCLYLIHIHIKFHEDIPNDYRVMWCTRKIIKQNRTINNNQRAIILKLKNGE